MHCCRPFHQRMLILTWRLWPDARIDDIVRLGLARQNDKVRMKTVRNLGGWLRRAPTTATWRRLEELSRLDEDQDVRDAAKEVLKQYVDIGGVLDKGTKKQQVDK